MRVLLTPDAELARSVKRHGSDRASASEN